MADLIQVFMDRAQAVGAAVQDDAWRWGGAGPHEHLAPFLSEDGKSISFRQMRDWKGMVTFSNIIPKNIEGLVFHDPVILRSENIDAVSSIIDNSRCGLCNGIIDPTTLKCEDVDGKVSTTCPTPEPLEQTYSATFAKSQSEEDSIKTGLSVAVSSTFKATAGGEAFGGSVEAETSIETKVENEWGKVSSASSSEERTVSFHVVVQPGHKIRIWATRAIDKMKRIITGYGTFESDVTIGKHWDHHWRGSMHWDTFADFLAVAEGNRDVPSNWRKLSHHVSSDILSRLKNEARSPFRQETEFDNVTATTLRQQEIDPHDLTPEEVSAGG